MVDERDQLDRYLERYDDLAVQVLDDERSNSRYGIPWSNADLAQSIMHDMEWEAFDLFMPIDYAGTYAEGSIDVVRCYCYLAFLRMMVFAAAFANGVGEPEFNKTAVAHSEYWFKRLKDRCESLTKKEDRKSHKWIH